MGLAVALVVAVGLASVAVLRRGSGEDGSDELTSQTSFAGPSPAAVLAAAPAATRAAGTARIRTSMHSIEDGEALQELVEGVIGFGTQAYDLTYRPEGAGSPTQVPDGFESFRAFSDGTTVWATIPPGMDALPQIFTGSRVADPFKGKKYLASRVGDEEQLLPELGLSGGALGFSIGSAPGDVLGYLSGVGTAAEDGPEQIDGEDVTRYRVEFDLDALQRALPSEARTFDAYDFKPDVPHTFPAKVWLDRTGRLFRLTYRLDLATLLTDVALREDYLIEECPEPDADLISRAMAGDRKAGAALDALDERCTDRPARPEELVVDGSIEISDYGVALAVTPPPAREVVTAEQVEAFFDAQADAVLGGGPPTTAKRRAARPSATKASSTTTTPTTRRRTP